MTNSLSLPPDPGMGSTRGSSQEPRDKGETKTSLDTLIKVVEQSPASILVTDVQGRIEYVNPKFSKATGYSLEEVLGQNPRILRGDSLPDEFYQNLWASVMAGNDWHGIFHNRTKSGETVWQLASISPIRDDQGTITHFVGVHSDYTEIKRLQDRMRDLAHHDQLTGLPNRTLFYDRLKQAKAIAKRRDEGFALFYLDLDGFKAVNDRHGHELGDNLLKAVGQRLLDCVRASDTVARLGGDEFALLLPELNVREDAANLARSIIEALSRPFQIQDVSCSIGVSIGISFFPQDGEDNDLFISHADAAMYQVKKAGKNAFAFWS